MNDQQQREMHDAVSEYRFKRDTLKKTQSAYTSAKAIAGLISAGALAEIHGAQRAATLDLDRYTSGPARRLLKMARAAGIDLNADEQN